MTSSESNGPILITGATGRTGRHVVRQLSQAGVSTRAFVRTLDKAEDLDGVEWVQGDLRNTEAVRQAVAGSHAMVIAAGATPHIEPNPGGPPRVWFDEGQRPEDIDYKTTVSQIDAAKEAGLHHVVLVSSAGVTDPNHRLNRMDNSNLLVWKLKAEDYLRASGLRYTVVRPGRLFDDGQSTDRHLVVDAEDRLAGAVLRSDVARVCVHAVLDRALPSLTFNLSADPGDPNDLDALLRRLIPTTS